MNATMSPRVQIPVSKLIAGILRDPESSSEIQALDTAINSPVGAGTPGIPPPDQELTQLKALATKLGMTLQPESMMLAELGGEIAARMTPRIGANVYQMPAFIMHCFPGELLSKILGEFAQPETSQPEWLLDTVSALHATMPHLLSLSDYVCAGITKSLRAQSEPFIRVVAALMPNMQMVHVVKERGVSRTYINFAYALVTEHGEVHWPKTKDRREVAVDPETEEELRMQVLSDMQELADRGHPLGYFV